MAILDESQRGHKKRVIDLSGPDGNAYVLLAIAKSLSKQLEMDWKQIQFDMTSGDYQNLITQFDEYFGDYVDLQQ